MKILIVEDDENSRIFLESALTASGYEVDAAVNGNAALAIADSTPPDLIISDILMPEMDGYALCRAVKSSKRLSSIPFIFYTATYTDPEDEKLAMDMGASRFLVKPMDFNQLLEEISNAIHQGNEHQSSASRGSSSEGKLQEDYAAVLAKKLDKKIRQLEKERNRLEISEKRYRRLVETLRDDYFFYTHDVKGEFTYISPSIKNVLGYTQEEFCVHYSEYLTDGEINRKVRRYAERCLQGEKQSSFEVDIYHKNGEVHRLVVAADPVRDENGRVTAVEGIVHDITNRIVSEKQLAKAQERLQQSQKMEAIGTLASGIAHDFNNILSPIIGYTEITQLRLPESSKERENLQEVLKAASRAKELVMQILTFSRHTEQEKKSILLQTIVKESLKLMRSSIPATVETAASIDPECDAILADPTQMHQVLMNLCTNAYQAMRENGGLLTVSLSGIDIGADGYLGSDLKKGRYLRVEVSDTGSGIAFEHQKRIFEPYFTTKPKDEGTGLGLSVVHGIVTTHGGHITVYSEPGIGTTFHVYLPTIEKQDAEDENETPEEIVGGAERILFVDDDIIIGDMAKKMLESLGYSTTFLSNGSDAALLFRRSPEDYDLLITDMCMRDMTGADLAKKVLAIRPDMPIILCTGFSDLIDKEKAAAIGIKKYLMKPIGRNELAKAIRTVLDEG